MANEQTKTTKRVDPYEYFGQTKYMGPPEGEDQSQEEGDPYEYFGQTKYRGPSGEEPSTGREPAADRSKIEQAEGFDPSELEPMTDEELAMPEGPPEWVEQQREGIQEAWSPPEIFAAIFSGGSYAAARGGAPLGKALARGGIEAAVGTATDVPVSLAGDQLREKYGWGPAMLLEVSAGLAAGMTIDRYVVDKLTRLGRSWGSASALKDKINKPSDQLLKNMDEVDKLLGVVEDTPEIMKALPPGQGDTLAEQTFKDYDPEVNVLPMGKEPIPVEEIKARADVPEEAYPAIDEEFAAAAQRKLEKGQPDVGRPPEPATQPVSKEARRELIAKIAKAKGADEVKGDEDVAADSALLMDELAPKKEVDVPKKRVPPKGWETQKRAQEEVEDFLGFKLDNYENGVRKEGTETTAGYPDEAYELDNVGDIPMDVLDEVERGVRTWDDVLNDIHTVFGNKLGLSIEDVSKKGADQEAALHRLAGDLKAHEYEALKLGISIEDLYQQKGYTPETAARLGKYTKWFHQNRPELIEEGQQATQEAVKPKVIDVEKEFRSPMRLFSVEWPFRKVGAEDSGLAFKLVSSIVDLYGDEGIGVVRRMRREAGEAAEDNFEAALKAEDSAYNIDHMPADQKLRVERAAKLWNDYAEKSFNDLKEAGVLSRPFPESAIERRQEKINMWQQRLLEVTDQKKHKALRHKIDRAQEEIKLMEGKKYAPILKQWFDKLDRQGHTQFRKILKLHAEKKRETPLLKTLVDQGIVSKEEVDIRNMVGVYARKKGHDIAWANVRNSLEADGLIRRVKWRDKHGRVTKDKSKKDNWNQLDPMLFPAFKDYTFHPAVAEYMRKYSTAIGKHSKWEDAMNMAKMAQFINPIIMPMYDGYQTAMLQFLRPWQVPGNVRDGLLSYFRQDEDFQQAVRYGLASKPYPNPVRAHKLQLDQAKYGKLETWMKNFELHGLPMKNKVARILAGSPKETLRLAYNTSWDLAWSGDMAIRMISYKALKKQGFEPRDAAQLAALFHGDYASVPPGTRKQLNKIFFTPTFKIAMAKLNTEMIKAAVDSFTKHSQKKLPPSDEVAKAKFIKKQMAARLGTKVLAGGLMGLFVANQAKDMIMTNLGFERDTWGRRYVKEIDTPEGAREIVHTFSDPANTILKYIQHTYETFTEPIPSSDTTAYGKWLRGFRQELHPAIRIAALEAMNNERWNGERMYSPNDSTGVKMFKFAEYLVGEFIPMLSFAGVGARESEDDDIIRDHYGQVWSRFINLFTYTYVREPERLKAKRLMQDISKNVRSDMEKGTYDEDNQRRVLEQMKALEEFTNEKYKR